MPFDRNSQKADSSIVNRSVIDITSEGGTLQKSNSCSLNPGFSVADLQLGFSEEERDSGVSADNFQ